MILDRTVWSNGFDNSIEIAFSSFFDSLPSVLKKGIAMFSALNEMGFFIILVGIILIFIKKTRKFGIMCIVSLLVTALLNDVIIKNICSRARPYEDLELLKNLVSIQNNGGQVYGVIPTSSSFPSGHTATAFSVFGCSLFLYIFTKEEKKLYLRFMIFFLVFSILMGLSRILLSHHYTTDVLAGTLVGTIGGIASYYIVIYSTKLIDKLKIKYYKNKEN